MGFFDPSKLKRGEYLKWLRIVNEWMKTLQQIRNRDVSAGAVFGSQYFGIVGVLSRALALSSSEELSQASTCVESRMPGLKALYDGYYVHK